ncbi:MAG TPA: MFS transporter [Verrucomicrobiae bacterium]|nr:MFS transporter [Verrucomicrobiae bacterium]
MASTQIVAPSHSSTLREWIILHLSFVLIGVITTVLGPILPYFSHTWSLTDAQAGFFFTSQYFFSTLGVILTSLLLPRFGFSRVCAAGFAAFTLGFLFLGLSPWIISVLMVGVNGFGYGLTNPSINLRATQLPSKNTAAAVTFLNFSWSLGAVLCPFLVAGLVPRAHVRGFSLVIAVCAVLLVAAYLASRNASQTTPARATYPLAEWLARLRVPQAMPLLWLFLFYVGTEVALGGWVASFEKRLPGMSSVTLVIAPSVYYGALLFGRGVASLAFRQFTQLTISVSGLFIATVGASLIAISHSATMLYAGSAIAGFGLAPQYPIFVTWLAALFHKDANWIGALFFSFSGIGGGAIPWLVGIVSAATHSLRAGLLLPLAVCFLMIFLVMRARPDSQVGHSKPA